MSENGQNREEGQTLEELFSGIEDVIQRMEEDDVSLEDSFHLYHKGIDILKMCNDKIDKVEKKMQILDEEGETHEF